MKSVEVSTLQRGDQFHLTASGAMCTVTAASSRAVAYTCEDGSFGVIATWKYVWIRPNGA